MNTQIKAIIGLGNPGAQYYKTRHSIGFRIIDQIAQDLFVNWNIKDSMEYSKISIDQVVHPNFYKEILLIKPTTFMNSSGKVIPSLTKSGIKAEEILVIHDELEKAFGHIGIKLGGSAKGHNGLRSIIETIGEKFWRLRFGIGRPIEKAEVRNFVLANFTKEEEKALTDLIPKAANYLLEFNFENLK